MKIVKLSPEVQVVIPKEIRESLNLKSGQRLQICVPDGAILLRVPRSIESLRCLAKGMEWKDTYREH
jgi:AbrB family looped-hinge helix DNA binding protein